MFDVAVIGGGPGGYLAAERAGQAGLSCVCFEERSFGGVCLNEGCIPSKTFLHSAIVAGEVPEASRFALTLSGGEIDMKQLQKRKNKIVKKLVLGVKQALTEAKVEMVEGHAQLKGKPGDYFEIVANEQVYQAKNVILATGSTALIPPLPGVQEGLANGFVLTNREVVALEERPERLVIVGGGVIGLEMAAFFRLAGTEVTVVEMLDHIAGPLDADLSAGLLDYLTKLGVKFELSAKVTGLESNAVLYEKAGVATRLECDKVLMSIGRRARLADCGLETVGLDPKARGLEHDQQMRTSVPGLYVVGDLTGRYQLAHAAYREAEVALRTICGEDDAMSYEALPSVVYGPLEAASAGPSEAELTERGVAFDKVTLPLAYAGRFLAETERVNGFCKILYDPERQLMLACHVLGSYASEIIAYASLAINEEISLERLRRQIFPHPTVCEIIRECLYHIPH